MTGIAASAAIKTEKATPAIPPKLAKVAKDFEAILIETLLRQVEDSLATLPGGDNSSGMRGYDDLATQAMAAGLAQSGGLGIAGMIIRKLMPPKPMSLGTGGPNGAKGFSSYADSN
jgi:Rod binding domain-containing protein